MIFDSVLNLMMEEMKRPWKETSQHEETEENYETDKIQ